MICTPLPYRKERSVREIKGLRSAGRLSPGPLSSVILSGFERLSSCERAETSPLPSAPTDHRSEANGSPNFHTLGLTRPYEDRMNINPPACPGLSISKNEKNGGKGDGWLLTESCWICCEKQNTHDYTESQLDNVVKPDPCVFNNFMSKMCFVFSEKVQCNAGKKKKKKAGGCLENLMLCYTCTNNRAVWQLIHRIDKPKPRPLNPKQVR